MTLYVFFCAVRSNGVLVWKVFFSCVLFANSPSRDVIPSLSLYRLVPEGVLPVLVCATLYIQLAQDFSVSKLLMLAVSISERIEDDF